MGDVLQFRRPVRRRCSEPGSFPAPHLTVEPSDDVPIVATGDDGTVLLITDVQPDGTVTGLSLTPPQARSLAADLIVQAARLEGA